jgi:hypothetical protein
MRSPLSVVLPALFLAVPVQAQMIGSYTGGAGDPVAASGFAAMRQAMGRTPAVALAYIDSQKPMSEWIASSQYEAGHFAAAGWSRPLIPMLGLPMAGPGQNSTEAFRAFASGSLDGMLNSILKAWSDRGFQNILLRPGFEMNGAWFSWSVNAGNAADFVAAFQHIAMVAHTYQDAIVTVIWNPNVGATIPLDLYYPASKYVDAIGLDTYGEPLNSNSSPADAGSETNLSLSGLIAYAKAKGKPFALPEIGADGHDPAFPTQLAAALLRAHASVLVAGFWCVNDPNGPMRWTDDAATSAAWRAVADIISGSRQVQLVTVPTGQGDGATATIPDPGPTLPAPVADTTPLPAPLRADAPQGVPVPPAPATPAIAAPTIVVSDPNGVVMDTEDGPQTITVTAPGAIVGMFRGPETVTLQGPGTALTTGAYNDTVTVQSTGNTIDLGWGNDTVMLAYPTAPIAVPITLAAAHATVATAIGDGGNRFYLPAPQTGVLTINGTLAKGDTLDLSKALAVTTWDHQPATLGQYVATGRTAGAVTISVNGVVVARIVGHQTESLPSMIVAN